MNCSPNIFLPFSISFVKANSSSHVVIGPAVFLVFLLPIVFLVLYFIRPALGISFFIIVRITADFFGSCTVSLFGFSLNLAGALGISICAVGVFSLLTFQKNNLKILIPFVFLVLAVLIESVVGWMRFGTSQLFREAPEVVRTLAIPLFFISVCRIRHEPGKSMLYMAIWFSILLCGTWGAVQFICGAGTFEATSGVQRATGPFAFPNTLGYVCLLGLNLLIGGIVFEDGGQLKSKTRIFLIAVLLVFLSLTLSFTIFALFAVSVCMFLFLKRRIAILVLLFFFFLFSTPLFLPRVKMLLHSNPAVDFKEGVAENTFTARLVIWRELFSVFRERPVLGSGLKTIARVNPVTDFIRGVGSDPHNDLILFMVEGGIVGLFLIIAFHLSVLFFLGRLAYRLRNVPGGSRAVSTWIMYVGMMLGSLVNNLLSFTAFLFLFWAMVGLSWAETLSLGDAEVQ